jgi:cytochrome b561
MPVQQLQLRCEQCSAVTTHTQRTPNHVLHLLLSVLTAGLWIVAWIIVSIRSKDARCEQCGRMRQVA